MLAVGWLGLSEELCLLLLVFRRGLVVVGGRLELDEVFELLLCGWGSVLVLFLGLL
jgi:hypothetical protein